jgi:aldehyde dehydrogenase (NAD+)
VEIRSQLFIGGSWVQPQGTGVIEVVDAATEEVFGRVPAGSAGDVDAAARSAADAFTAWSQAPVRERSAALRAIADGLEARTDELAVLMSREVGTPLTISERVQVGLALSVFRSMADLIEQFPLEERLESSIVLRVPAGVVGAITPWNYPLYQLAAKLGPALAAGCTTVIKPSSVAPLAAFVLADVIAELDLPPGTVNMVTGRGAEAGEAIAAHPAIDLISLTGSTSAGARVAEVAAPGIKRMALELGGKSAFIIAEGADLDVAVPNAVRQCFVNNGQTCAATTRLVVPVGLLGEIEQRVTELVAAMVVGNPLDPETDIGPVASDSQFRSIQAILSKVADDGTILVGGPGQAPGQARGYFVQPTVVSRVSNQALVAREEVFGPVLAVIPVRDVDQAVAVANDSDYGLSGAVFAADEQTAIGIARRLRTGQVAINGGRFNVQAPFGGFRKSGVGRELGPHGLAEYFELVSLQLPTAPTATAPLEVTP